MDALQAEFAEQMMKCQQNVAFHKSSLAAIRHVKDQNPRLFVKLWLDTLNRVLVESRKHQSVERLVKFIGLAAVSYDEAFRDFTVQYVIRKTDSRDWAPRFRACQILGVTLKNLAEDAELGDKIWDEIYKRMMDRLDDRAPAVRIEAVGAIQRLQDPSDPEDPIINKFVEMMREDPSGDVRKAVCNVVAVCKTSLKEIISRTRDVHAPTRRQAFRSLAYYVNIKNLKISQRTQLIRDGLRDRDEKVQKECSKMCLVWLENLEKDVLQLLHLMDVEAAEDAGEEMLKVLFRDVQGGVPVRVNPEEKLSSEAALYMRVLAQHWKSRVDDAYSQQAFETQVPELMAICHMMDLNSGNDFVLKQLLVIAAMKDFSDEAGRVALSALLRTLLPSPQVSQLLVEPIMKVLTLCHEDEEFVQVVLEMISDVREPLDFLQTEQAKHGMQKAAQRYEELKVKYEKLKKLARIIGKSSDKSKLPQLKEAEKRAQDIKTEMQGLEQSIANRSKLEDHIWYRVLCVTELMLETTKQGLKHPAIFGLLNEILLPALEINSVVVRSKALRCLSMYCLLDRTSNTVKTHIRKFIDATSSDNSEVRLTAIKSLFDIGMLYGFNSIEEDDLFQRLSRYVEDESQDIQTRGIVAEGFAKLYLMGKCHDSKILGSLLLLFFAPATAIDERLRQCLAVFFPTYAFTMQQNQELLCQMAIPTMRRILLADPLSSVRKIDWSLFCKFVAHLVDPSNATYEFQQFPSQPSWHERIMCQIAFEMHAPEKGFNPHWARALSHFQPRDPAVTDDLESSLMRLRFVAKIFSAINLAVKESSDKRVQQWADKRAASVRDVIMGSAMRSHFTEDLMRQVTDEMETDLDLYLAERHLEPVMSSSVADLADEESSVSPVRPKQKKAEKAEPARGKAKAKVAAASSGWGIAVEKRDRQPLVEQATVVEDESPPKKEKTSHSSISQKRKDTATATRQAPADTMLMDCSDDRENNASEVDEDMDAPEQPSPIQRGEQKKKTRV